jgi:HlyD family secretion protein
MRKISTGRYLFTIALPLVAIAVGSLFAFDFGAKRSAEVSYDTVAADRGTIRKMVSTSGPVRALVTVSVGSQLSGQIVALKVDFNSEVKPGDVMAILDDKTFVAKLAQTKADFAAAEAGLINAQAALQKSEAQQKQAERAVSRTRELAARGISAQAALDTATRDSDVAKADIALAKAQIETAKATIAQRRAQVEQAQIDVDRTRILSPINGTVISRTIDVGQTVAASLQAPELFKIAQDIRRIRIEAQVNEADVGVVAEGNVVEFSVDAYPERKFTGVVTQVRLAATELNNVVTYTVIIEAMNDDRKLFPGMTANVQIETAKRENVLRISNDALRFKPRDKSVVAAAEKGGQGGSSAGGQGGGSREQAEQRLQQLKDELQLSDDQVERLRDEMRKFRDEMRAQMQTASKAGPSLPGMGGGPPAQANPDGAGFRARYVERVEQVLKPILTDAQKPLFDRWKRGRENTRSGTVYVLASGNVLEQRSVRLGVADDQFSEIIGGGLKDGDRVVTRMREVKKN